MTGSSGLSGSCSFHDRRNNRLGKFLCDAIHGRILLVKERPGIIRKLVITGKCNTWILVDYLASLHISKGNCHSDGNLPYSGAALGIENRPLCAKAFDVSGEDGIGAFGMTGDIKAAASPENLVHHSESKPLLDPVVQARVLKSRDCNGLDIRRQAVACCNTMVTATGRRHRKPKHDYNTIQHHQRS